MGYSVLIPLNKSEQEKVRRFIDLLTAKGVIDPATAEPDGTAKADSLFGRFTSDPRMKNLSYKGRYKNGTYVGCDYGDHDIAHTFVNWMAKTLGKTHYIYDGSVKTKVKHDKIINTNLMTSKREPYSEEAMKSLARFLKTDKITTREEWEIQQQKTAEFRKEYRRKLFRLVNTLQKAWNELNPTP